jgi:hypothetical protein
MHSNSFCAGAFDTMGSAFDVFSSLVLFASGVWLAKMLSVVFLDSDLTRPHGP